MSGLPNHKNAETALEHAEAMADALGDESCESEQVLLEIVRRGNERMAHDGTIARLAIELLAAMDYVCGLAWRDSLARKDDEVDTAWIRLIDAVETSRPARDIRGAL